MGIWTWGTLSRSDEWDEHATLGDDMQRRESVVLDTYIHEEEFQGCGMRAPTKTCREKLCGYR